MIPSVEKILRDNYVEGVYYTHVSLLQPKGKFSFNRSVIEDFWNIYMEKIKDEKAMVGVAEKPGQYLPVLVDVDIGIKSEYIEGDHIYTNEHVLQIIGIYQSVLRSIVEGCTDEHLTCVLLEKPIYYKITNETIAKNGFHLHFPYLFLDKVDQEVHLIPRVLAKIDELNVFADIGIDISSSVIDKSYCNVNWLIYGSRKSEDMDPYKISKIFNSDLQEIDIEKAFKNYQIFDMNEKPINIRGKVKDYLPRILSIIPYNRRTFDLRRGLISPLKEQIQEKEKKIKNTQTVSVQEALDISEKLLPMIADWRADDRNEWITVGWILFNIGEGCSRALEQWLEFSSRCTEKYDESACIYQWERMVKKDLTLGTLRYYASIDSPELYKEYKKECSDKYVKESLSGSHNDIAKVLYSEYANEFVCASIVSKTWYQFRDHRWEEIEDGVFLREKISNEIVQKYIEQAKDIFTKLANVKDKAEEAMYNARLKQITKLVGNLKSSPFKNNIMKECSEVFYDRRFKNKLDQNPYIIGFKNGVYDMKLNEFRAGRPEDFISKVLPIEYKEYDISHEDVQNVLDFLMKVFPDPELRKYFLDTYSDVFVGGNNQKKIYMWTGEGDNGKSITQLFFEKMLGILSVKFNTQYFTGKKISTGSANPELARAAPPVRLVTMEEPDGDEQLNIGELKKLSGGDSFWARDLFERGKETREVFPMFMLCFICNKLPKLKFSDKASWNRFRVLCFESTFVEPDQECPETLEEQMKQKRFPMDKNFKDKVPGMVPAFAWYLLNWRKNMTGIRTEPEKVKEATAIYRRQNDIYRQFIEECIIEDENASVTLLELYTQFKEWFRQGWPNTVVPIKNEIKEYFEKCWGEPERGAKWKGFRSRTLKDDSYDGKTTDETADDCLPDI